MGDARAALSENNGDESASAMAAMSKYAAMADENWAAVTTALRPGEASAPSPAPAEESKSEGPGAAATVTEPTPETEQVAQPPREGAIPTSTKNAVTDTERASRGAEPLQPGQHLSDAETWAQAEQQLVSDPQTGTRLVAELNENPRPITSVENDVLLRQKIATHNRGRELMKAINDPAASEDARVRASEELSRNDSEVDAIDTALRLGGTETGRALAARRKMADEDFTLVAMRARTRAAQGGAPLSSEQEATIKDLNAKLEASQKRIAELEAKGSQEQAEATLNNLKDETGTRQKPLSGPVRSKLMEKLKASHDEAVKNLRSRLGRTSAGVDPTILADVAKIGAYHIANGARRLSDFTTRMVKELGEWIRADIKPIFTAAQAEYDSARDAARELEPADAREAVLQKVAQGKLTQKNVFDLARHHVNGGIVELGAVMDAVKKDLADSHPDITTRELRDLFSGYGEVRYPSKEADLVKLRELRRLGQLASAIEDAQRKIAPKKSGGQRDDPTQAIRDKMKELQDAMKEAGIEATSPEQQLKSVNQARATALRNQIEDLDRQLQTGTAPVRGSKEVAPTPEVDRLRSERDAMKAELSRIEAEANPPKSPEQKALEARIKAVEKSIEEIDKRLQGEPRKASAPKPTSPELERFQAERDAMREQLSAMEATPKKSDAVRQLEQLEKTKQRLDEVLSGARPPNAPVDWTPLSSAAADLKAEVLAMQELAAQMKRDAKPPGDPNAAKERAEIKALEKSIEEYSRRVREADFSTRGPTQGPPRSKAVADLRAIRDSRRSMYETARKMTKPVLTAEEKRIKTAKSAIERSTKRLQERIAAGAYAPTPRREPATSKELEKLRFENAKVKEEFHRKAFEAKLAAQSLPRKALRISAEVANTSRAVMTSADLSAMFRQGGFIALAHPIRALKSVLPMLKAFASERAAFKVDEEIAARPNAKLYQQSKLYLAEKNNHMPSKMEEAYMSRWAQKIPLVAGSARAYTTFLNKLRADSFDAMASTISATGKPSLEEAKAIANFINVATGRGTLGKAEAAGQALATAFFSPRYVASRFQLIAGQPFMQGTARTRKLVAQEYGRYLLGLGVIYALAAAAPEDEDISVEFDPRSSDFGKIKIGNTRVDVLSGLAQVTTFLSREVTGETKALSGKETRLREGLRPLNLFRDVDPTKKDPFGTDGAEVAARFLRSKLAPVPGAVVNLAAGRNMIGEPASLGTELGSLAVPLSVRDIYETMLAQGATRGTALMLLSLLGMGVQTYEAKPAK